jgi:hypothetical protein
MRTCCVCVFSLRRESPNMILGDEHLLFRGGGGGSVTVGTKGRLGSNAHSKHLKIANTLMVSMLSPYKDYSSLLRWQANICVYIATTELHQ